MRASWANLLQATEAVAFAFANRLKGNLDPQIYSYPTIRIMRVENGEGNAVCYLPVHSAAILETLGWAPGLNAEHKVEAGITALEQVEREAWNSGCREVLFVSSDDRTDEFCQRQLGYEKIMVLRKRL